MSARHVAFARTRYEHELPFWIWGGVPILPLLTLPAVYAWDPSTYDAVFNRKEGVLDWITVLFLVPAIGAGLPSRWLRAWTMHPADVALGLALGNFSAVFLQEAFLGLPDTVDLHLGIDPANEEIAVGFTWSP